MFFTVTQIVKNLLAMQETQVQFLAWEDPLEEEMETHSSILAWKIPWIEESSGLWSKGSQRVRHDWVSNTSFEEQISKPHFTIIVRKMLYNEQEEANFT